MKVLIVDDNKMDISIISEAIKAVDGITASFADSADKAIKMAINNKPDLIILDVVMPNMDGIEVKSRLSRAHSTSGIPVIFVTSSEGAETDCYRIGCIEYLTKPIDMKKLIHIIKHQSFITKLDELITCNRGFAQQLLGCP
ncbi:MAG: response regulator [Glaciecola sp.]|jgi:CheY-like chemotaxis protein